MRLLLTYPAFVQHESFKVILERCLSWYLLGQTSQRIVELIVQLVELGYLLINGFDGIARGRECL
jgi:hypothetical protein